MVRNNSRTLNGPRRRRPRWDSAVQEGKESSQHRQSDSCKRSTTNVDCPALRNDGFADLGTHSKCRELAIKTTTFACAATNDKHRQARARRVQPGTPKSQARELGNAPPFSPPYVEFSARSKSIPVNRVENWTPHAGFPKGSTR